MNRCRQYITYLAVFLSLTVSLYLLMVLSAAIPNAAIQKNMRSSAAYYIDTERYAFSEDGSLRNVTDNHADQMWLNIGWNMGLGNPFLSALDTRYYDGEEYGTAVGLYMTITRGKMANADYTRYWHGTAGLLRILHLFTDIQGIKAIGMLFLVVLVWKTVRILVRDGYWDLGICLLAALFWVQMWNLRLSVEYLPCFLICFGLCPGFLRLEKKGDFYVLLLAVISGTLTAFLDFLTTETVTILIPLILVVAVRSRERRLNTPLSLMRLLACCGLCWLMAYVGMFVIKWVLVSVATGENHLLAAINAADRRINGVVTVGQFQRKPGFFMAIAANFSALFEGTSRTEYRQVIGTLIGLAILIVVVYRLNQVTQKLRPGTLFILLLGSVVLLRYGLLANHSYMHAFFTYRALVSTILSVLVAMVINLHSVKRKGQKNGTDNFDALPE